jgi:hypothetical protein
MRPNIVGENKYIANQGAGNPVELSFVGQGCWQPGDCLSLTHCAMQHGVTHAIYVMDGMALCADTWILGSMMEVQIRQA